MSDSWAHAIRPLTREERTWKVWQSEGEPIYHPAECSSPRCKQEAEYVGTYNYVTGRAGRVSVARRYLCAAHADKFRTKHNPQVTGVGS